MPIWRSFGLLTGVAAGALLSAGTTAQALVIAPSIDDSWAAAPAAATTVVNSVLSEFETDFGNPIW